MDMDREQQLQKLQQHLESIGEKEKLLTSGMRRLADQADALMTEMDLFKETLGSLGPVAAKSEVSKTEEPIVEKPALSPSPQAPKLDSFAKATQQEPVQPTSESPTPSSSWLDRELQHREPVAHSEYQPEVRQIIPNSKFAAPPPELKTSTPDYESFELNLGIKWLSRIGIVALLIGLAMALSYSFPSFPKELKIITGVLVATVLWFGGTKLYDNAPILSRVLQGGGLAVGYLSLFAIFFIQDVQLLNVPILGFFLLLAYVGGILWLSHRINSQSMSLLSLAFGYYTAGYAISDTSAFVSTAMLILGTAGLARLHPKWTVLPKANLLGAFWTYLFWQGRTTETFAQVYLAYVFLVFHVISVLRAGKGDAVLNVMNAFGCYIIYSLTQTPNAKGLLEFLIATIQLGSLGLVYLNRPDQREESLSRSLLILGLVFGLFGVGRYFDAQQQPVILSSLALCFGLLAKKDIYRSIMQVAAYFTLAWSSWTLILDWHQFNNFTVMWNAAWVTGSAFLLEGIAFREHAAGLRGTMLTYVMLLYLSAIWSAVPAEWRTISMVLSGFILLAAGFAARRKVYRWIGLGWIFGLGGLSLVGDIWMLSTLYKILLFILLGVGLLGGSYGYVLLEKTLHEQDEAIE